MRAASINLGAVKLHSHAVPFYAAPQVNLSLWILPALIVLTVFICLCRKIFLQQSMSTLWLIAVSLLFFLVIGISDAMIDGYREGQLPAFLEPYTRIGLEYYGDVPKVNEVSIAYFFRDYAEP